MICVDASVAAKWVLPEEFSPAAVALYEVTIRAAQPVVAPPLLPFEVANIIRRRMVRQALPLPDAERLLAQFLAFPVALAVPAGLYQRALTFATAHQLPAIYDAHYVALAEAFGCELWTDDRRLLRLLAGRLTFVKWIGDYADGADA